MRWPRLRLIRGHARKPNSDTGKKGITCGKIALAPSYFPTGSERSRVNNVSDPSFSSSRPAGEKIKIQYIISKKREGKEESRHGNNKWVLERTAKGGRKKREGEKLLVGCLPLLVPNILCPPCPRTLDVSLSGKHVNDMLPKEGREGGREGQRKG